MTYEHQLINYKKVYLDIDSTYRLNGDLFGNEWNSVRRQQIKFLLERPLIFRVVSEKFWGPQHLHNLFVQEWWETEQRLRGKDRKKETEEIADMTLLLLTLDSLNPRLLLSSQISLLKMGWSDTVRSYSEEIHLNTDKLMSAAKKKIKMNCFRNPEEAFMLIAEEDMQISIKRMEQNWSTLKKKRDEPARLIVKRKDWWKKWLYVDENGWVKELKS